MADVHERLGPDLAVRLRHARLHPRGEIRVGVAYVDLAARDVVRAAVE